MPPLPNPQPSLQLRRPLLSLQHPLLHLHLLLRRHPLLHLPPHLLRLRLPSLLPNLLLNLLPPSSRKPPEAYLLTVETYRTSIEAPTPAVSPERGRLPGFHSKSLHQKSTDSAVVLTCEPVLFLRLMNVLLFVFAVFALPAASLPLADGFLGLL